MIPFHLPNLFGIITIKQKAQIHIRKIEGNFLTFSNYDKKYYFISFMSLEFTQHGY